MRLTILHVDCSMNALSLTHTENSMFLFIQAVRLTQSSPTRCCANAFQSLRFSDFECVLLGAGDPPVYAKPPVKQKTDTRTQSTLEQYSKCTVGSSEWATARSADWCVNTVFTGPRPHICSAAVLNGYQFGVQRDYFGGRTHTSDPFWQGSSNWSTCCWDESCELN